MKSRHPLIKDFVKFADHTLENRDSFKSVSQFARAISGKAQLLFKMAASNPLVDLHKLQKEIHEIGRVYLLKFSAITEHAKKYDNTESNKSSE